jgi:hypothetical protein
MKRRFEAQSCAYEVIALYNFHEMTPREVLDSQHLIARQQW